MRNINNGWGQLYFRKARHAEAIEAFVARIGGADDAGRGDRPDMAYALKREGQTEAAGRTFCEAISGYRKRTQKNPRSISPLVVSMWRCEIFQGQPRSFGWWWRGTPPTSRLGDQTLCPTAFGERPGCLAIFAPESTPSPSFLPSQLFV